MNDVVIDTSGTKLGAIHRGQREMGVLSSVMPGKMIGDGCWIGANVMIEEDVERRTHVMLKQELILRKRKEGEE